MRIVGIISFARNHVFQENGSAAEELELVGEILDQDMGLPEGEVFAGVCHGGIPASREFFAVLSSGYPPDGVRLRCVLIHKDEWVREVLGVEGLTDGEVRHVVKVGAVVYTHDLGGIAELSEGTNVEIVLDQGDEIRCQGNSAVRM